MEMLSRKLKSDVHDRQIIHHLSLPTWVDKFHVSFRLKIARSVEKFNLMETEQE